MSKSDIAKLADTYIDEVLSDQKALGYNARVDAQVRQEAERHAETALTDLSASSRVAAVA